MYLFQLAAIAGSSSFSFPLSPVWLEFLYTFLLSPVSPVLIFFFPPFLMGGVVEHTAAAHSQAYRKLPAGGVPSVSVHPLTAAP